MEEVFDIDEITFLKGVMLTADEKEDARQVIADVLGIEPSDVVFNDE